MYKRTVAMLIALGAQYLLGMYVNMFAAPPDDPKFKTEGLFPKVVFGTHALLGLGILVGSVAVLILAIKSRESNLKKIGTYGFLSVFLAFCGGIATISLKDNASEISSYVMSAGFLLSFVFYGKLFYLLKKP